MTRVESLTIHLIFNSPIPADISRFGNVKIQCLPKLKT